MGQRGYIHNVKTEVVASMLTLCALVNGADVAGAPEHQPHLTSSQEKERATLDVKSMLKLRPLCFSRAG